MANDFVLRFLWCLICDSPHLSSLPLGISISHCYLYCGCWLVSSAQSLIQNVLRLNHTTTKGLLQRTDQRQSGLSL